jgi:hypothetical protein
LHELRCNWCKPQLTAATGGNWCGCNNRNSRNWWQLVQAATHKPQLVATGVSRNFRNWCSRNSRN